MPAKPALRTELLFYLSFLAAAALLVGVVTILVATSFAPERPFVLVMLLVVLEVGVFVVFGRQLVNRLVLWPLDRVGATADAVAAGDLARRAPDEETRDFATLAGRLNRMTDYLLDAQGPLGRAASITSAARDAACPDPSPRGGERASGAGRRGCRCRWRRDLGRAPLGVRAPEPGPETRHGPRAGDVSPYCGAASQSRRVLCRPARRTGVRRRLGPRCATRRPRQDLRSVLHNQGARPRHRSRPRYRSARRARHGW